MEVLVGNNKNNQTIKGPCAHGDCQDIRVDPRYWKRVNSRNATSCRRKCHQCDNQFRGFFDPLTVVHVCIPIFERATYILNQSKLSNDENSKTFCEAIQSYLDPWEEYEEVERAVQNYIRFPCLLELKATIRGSYRRALQFLINYLRARGPFMEWEIRPGNDEVMRRCLNTVLAGQMKQLSEVEYLSVIAIGRYLQYLNTVAQGHHLYYFRMILAKVWGPLFLRPFYSPVYGITLPPTSEAQRIGLGISIFENIIHSANWSMLDPLDSVETILQENDRDNAVDADTSGSSDAVNTYPVIPHRYVGTMSDKLKEKYIEAALEKLQLTCPLHPFEGHDSNRVEDNKLCESCQQRGLAFPPDNCRL